MPERPPAAGPGLRRRAIRGWRFAGAVGPGGRAPSLTLPEVAFAGRSNVGKSSLINRLTRSAGLARTSRTPGRTQQINFFVGDFGLAFADLPGYGYARVPDRVRASWGPLVENYLAERETLCGILVLVDARRGVAERDRQMLALAEEHARPCQVVLTKIDKLSQGERARRLRETAREIEGALLFSAATGEGEEQLWGLLLGWAEIFERARGATRDGH